jgi:hypothetical protein
VDINDVGSFCDAVEDIGANKGAMVCNSGFTSGAKNRAGEKGIDLFRAVDAENVDWPVYIAIPTVCDFRGIKSFRIRFVHSAPGPFAMPAVDPRYLEIYRRDGSFVGLLGNLFSSAWHDGNISDEPGEYTGVKFLREEAYTKFEDQIYGPVEITATLTVQQRLFFGQVPIKEGSGFWDERTRTFTTNSITTGLIDVIEVERSWMRIGSIAELSVRPFAILVVQDCYPEITLPSTV